jgi:hypothetical protein
MGFVLVRSIESESSDTSRREKGQSQALGFFLNKMQLWPDGPLIPICKYPRMMLDDKTPLARSPGDRAVDFESERTDFPNLLKT